MKLLRRLWKLIEKLLNLVFEIIEKITKAEIAYNVRNTIIQFVKFGLVGFSNTVISYATYYILVPLGCDKYVASIIGFFLSIINAFFWNNSYVFAKKADEERSLIGSFIKLFLSYAGTGLVLHNLLLLLWCDVLNISTYIAPIINLFITIPLNFVLNKLWAFRKKNSRKKK